jgi:hypothetical protein
LPRIHNLTRARARFDGGGDAPLEAGGGRFGHVEMMARMRRQCEIPATAHRSSTRSQEQHESHVLPRITMREPRGAEGRNGAPEIEQGSSSV